MKKIICFTVAFCALLAQMALPVAAQEITKPISVYEDTTIELDNAVYRDNYPAIAVYNDAKLTLVLKGKSVIERKSNQEDGLYSAIFLNDSSQIEIVDDPNDQEIGSLELKNWDFGICAGSNGNGSSIHVDGVRLIIDSTMGGICDMNGDMEEISIRNADVSVKNTEYVGIGSYFGGYLKNLSIDHSNIDVDSNHVGIGSDQASAGNVSINNSKLNVNSKLVGIGGRDAKISKTTISNSIGSVMVADDADMPFVGIGMTTGVAESLSGIGFIRVYTMNELTLKNNFLYVDSPVTCIGAARKVIENGEKGTSIKNLNIDGGIMFMRNSQENGVCIGAKDLNIENINIHNAKLTAMAKDAVIGCVEEEPNQVSKPTAINIDGQSVVIALGNRTFVPERNTLQVADTAALISDVTPLDESQINDAMMDFENALNTMGKPGSDFSGTIENLEELIGDGTHADLELLLGFIKDNTPIIPETPDEPDQKPDDPAKPEINPDDSAKPENKPSVPTKPDKTPNDSVNVEGTDLPNTGDQSNLLLLVTGMAISLAAVVVLSKKKKFD